MSAEDSNGYQGWANYPTWAVNLWLSNDESLYESTEEIVAANDRYDASRALQSFVESLPEVEAVTERASFVSDLLGYALGDVDWKEIVDAWCES